MQNPRQYGEDELNPLPQEDEQVVEVLGDMVAFAPGDDDPEILYANLLTICNAIYGTDFKGIDIAGAVLLTSILRDQPAMYKRYIQERGDNFLEIMESDELLSQMIAAQSCGVTSINTEESDVFDPVISGRSPKAVLRSPRGVGIPLSPRPGRQGISTALGFGEQARDAQEQARVAQEQARAEAAAYTELMRFVDTTMAPDRRRELCQLMYNLIDNMRDFISIIPQQGRAGNIRIYNNIQLVAGDLPQPPIMPTRPAQIFPKFSFNIVCRKEPLLQTVLVAGRENGMGRTLNDFVFTQLQGFFGPGVILKIVEPTDSNRLWQVKISIHKNDFVFFTIQIINVKDEFFAGVLPRDPINPINAALRGQILQNPALYDTYFQLFENLLFSLYNKANSKDFNCLCSLSELDIYIFRILNNPANPANIQSLIAYIRIFLTNLVDAQPNVKKKYFILGLSNLIFCSGQDNYTIETRAYRWLFDQPIPRLNVFAGSGQQNKNVFLHAMRLMQQVNISSLAAKGAGQRESVRFVMGGGKQYSLFQKALHRFSSLPSSSPFFDQCMQTVVDGIRAHPPIPGIDYTAQQDTLWRELHHALVKAAADLDAGIFHEEGVVGSTQCMAVCMLLQVSLKKLIDHLIRQGGVYDAYEVDIGNSCIGNPPTTLSSLRMGLNNSLLFYDDNPIIQQLVDQLDIDLANISSVISPFDYVPKGSMIQYTKHIIEAVSLFGDIDLRLPGELDTLTQLLSDSCMITEQGFSSPLKGIFDIFYTLFIIENFANRTFVTQKINKELKRISICAQILYLHYSQLIPLVQNGATIIQPMLNILRDMISYGYAGNLLNPVQFNIIMQKYVQFIRKLIEFNRDQQRLLLTYYCTPRPTGLGLLRPLTETERFFMNLLENSLDENDPANLAPPALPGNISVSLNCIPAAIRSVQGMDPQMLARLCQNKTYAAYRDTENKRNSVVAISMVYHDFLWNTEKRDRIKRGDIRDDEEREDARMFLVDPDNQGHRDMGDNEAIGLLDIFRGDNPNFFDTLLLAIEPCYNNPGNPAQNLMDISIDMFDHIEIDDTIKLQFIFWFITCIFGIKTKSATKKLISLSRVFLNGIRDNIDLFGILQRARIFGCVVQFPALPEPRPARVELQVFPAQAAAPLLPNFNPDDALYLAYDPYVIDKALNVYKTVEANFRLDPENYVFKMGNTLVVRKDSEVLRRDLMERLTESFCKLPRGQAYVNQSYNYMGPILHAVNRILRDFIRQPPQQLLVGNFLQSIREIPNLLTENPYNPKAHDVSKFVDFEENPQYYRNKWIIYFIHEMCNSENSDLKLFNHMKLFILLFRYLTMLPTVNIDGTLVLVNLFTRTTPEALEKEEGLIDDNYRCDIVRVRADRILPEIVAAQQEIEEVNEFEEQVIAAAAAAARPVNRRRGSRPTAPVVAAADADDGRPPSDDDEDMPPAPQPGRRARRPIPPTPAAAEPAAQLPARGRSGRQLAPVASAAALEPLVLAAPAQPSARGRSGRQLAPVASAAALEPEEIEPPSSRRRTGRATGQNSRQGGGTKINNHTRKNKYKYPNKVKVKKSNKSKKQKIKSKYKKSKVNVTFKRRRQRKSHK
jgi:hypothetical protein